jgi:hypothetical protein
VRACHEFIDRVIIENGLEVVSFLRSLTKQVPGYTDTTYQTTTLHMC